MSEIEKSILIANILIVDDQILNIKLLERLLIQAGYSNIFSTTDSRQAAALFVEHDIDLLLLDIRMPYMDGFAVMEKLSQVAESINYDYLPILVLTAELTAETRSKALNAGAKDFLTKPFDQVEALQRIRNILEVRVLHKKVILQNLELEMRVKERTQELEKSQLEIIHRLGLAAQYKDNETGNHVSRMSLYSKILAKAIGLSDEHVEMIYHATPMHDIGKIGIPDNVLLKPGKLNNDEIEIMRSHVKIGSDILSGSDVPIMILAKSIALTHHEWWDGTGYPQGLSGESIPIEGRICALCDTFDALTSKRPYKESWSIDKTMEYIHSQSGKHFDPYLIEVFERILDDIIACRNQYLDHI